ncbi:MAG: aminotransferase class I/II-fold pyridoxal phosphate-dependent enzyme [Phormidesmis sp. FL-bin-119]|nr:aminotransferase class I/II-fold pyridoxal phosphate-dependent enzyme [Pedobacter sp.]
MNISKIANTLEGSEIIKIAGEINELKKQGHQIANLTIGDFDSNIFPIPLKLTENIMEAYRMNQTNYPPAEGVASLRESISKFVKTNFDLDYSPKQIQVSGGSRPLIYGLFITLIDPGDRVVYPTPSWNNNHYCRFTGATDVPVQTSAANNFMPKAADIKPHLKGATLLALCSPLNPTGTMFSKIDLEEICDLVIEENKSRSADEKPLYIMYDQIYSQLTFGGQVHYDPVSLRPELKERVIYIDGISKCLAATGVRVGWAFGPEHVMSKMKTIIGHVGAWSPKPEQVATGQFLDQNADWNDYLDNFKEKIQKSLDTLYQGIIQLKSDGFAVNAIQPMGAIYLTIQIDYLGKKTPAGQLLNTSADLVFYLINEAGVGLVPFSAFSAEPGMNWFRASVGGCSLADIEEMLPRLRNALTKLI